MPTYEYRCKDCGRDLEVVQSFTDDSLTTCEACGGALRKLFGNVGIAFKGSGFYKNDSRGKAPSPSAGSSSESSSGDKATSDKSADSGSTTKTEASPPAKKDGKKDAKAASSSPASTTSSTTS